MEVYLQWKFGAKGSFPWCNLGLSEIEVRVFLGDGVGNPGVKLGDGSVLMRTLQWKTTFDGGQTLKEDNL